MHLHLAAVFSLLPLIAHSLPAQACFKSGMDAKAAPSVSSSSSGTPVSTMAADPAKICADWFEAAIAGNAAKMASLMADHPIDVDAHDPLHFHGTALNYAAIHGHADVVKLLLKHRANKELIPGYDTMGTMSSFMLATWRGKWATAELLLKAGANIHEKSSRDFTALQEACEAVDETDAGFIRLLIDAGSDVNAIDVCSGSVLMRCARHRNAEAVRLLIDAGADLSYRTYVSDVHVGYSAVSKYSGGTENLDLLLGHGVDFLTPNKHGITPLMEAAKFYLQSLQSHSSHHNLPQIAWLLKHGATLPDELPPGIEIKYAERFPEVIDAAKRLNATASTSIGGATSSSSGS